MTTKDKDMSEQSSQELEYVKSAINAFHGSSCYPVAADFEIESIATRVFDAARAPLLASIAELEDQLETERMRLAACSTAALGYFDGAIEKYTSQALHDVLALREKTVGLEAKLASQLSALDYAHTALKHSVPTHKHYPETVERHENALQAVTAAIDAAIRGNE